MENTEKKNTWFIILVIVLVVMVIGLTSYIVYDKVMDSKRDNVTVRINKNDENNNTEKLGKELFDKFTAFGDFWSGEIYSNKNLNYNNLDNSTRLIMALENAKNFIYYEKTDYEYEDIIVNEKEPTVFPYFKLSIKDFENSYKNLFGQDKNVSYEKFFSDSFYTESFQFYLTCVKEDAYLVCYPVGAGAGWQHESYYNYDFSELKDDKLYVYVNHFGRFIATGSSYNLCSDYDCNNVIDDTEYTNEDFEDTSKLFEKYKGKTGVYKLVFAKDTNDNWYWEETQIIKS